MKIEKLSILGVGNMGSAMVRGWIESKTFDPEQLCLYDTRREAVEAFPGCRIADHLGDLITHSKFIFFCVKPNILPDIFEEIGKFGEDRTCYVSIAAGVSIETIRESLIKGSGKNGKDSGKKFERLFRVMPNIPLQVREGAIAISGDSSSKKEDREALTGILSVLGRVVSLDERHIDAVTALSGSGPAFLFVLIEAMSDAGVAHGLPRNEAMDLAAQTVLGSAKMVLETGEHPARLKDMVASPGGTTIQGLQALEEFGYRRAIQAAIGEAVRRARELRG